MRSVLPGDIPFDMFGGTDARAAVADAAPGSEAAIAALEGGTGCRIYRGWPVTEVGPASCPPRAAEGSVPSLVACGRRLAAVHSCPAHV